MRIMYSIAMLIALAMPSLMTNSLVSKTVVLPAGVLENNIYWPKFQIYVAEIACICSEDIILASVITIRVEEEKKVSKQKWSRDYR